MGMLSGGPEIRIKCLNYYVMDMFVSLSRKFFLLWVEGSGRKG